MPTRTIAGIAELRSLVGLEVGTSGWRTISQDRIDKFAAITEDTQWIHVDTARATAESPYGTTIAHGFLTLSMLSELSREAVEIAGDFRMRINYGLNRVRFPAAVKSGARVRGRFALKSVEDVEGGVQIVWDCTVEADGGAKPCLVAEWVTRIYTS